eukprot:7277666-Prymnesium_polylepis.1
MPSGEPTTSAFEVTLSARLPPSGGGNCTADDDCFAGMCCGSKCSCLEAAYGERCEFQVDCTRWSSGASEWVDHACVVQINASVREGALADKFTLVTCACDQLGAGD